MSDLLVRLEVLRKVIDKASDKFPWCGSTAIQKLVYVLENVYEIDLGYQFGLHHYGPYSHDLGAHLSLGEQSDFWRSTTHAYRGRDGMGIGKRFTVKPIELPREIQNAVDTKWQGMEPKLTAALDRLGSFDSKRLELVATIHYLQHVQEVRDDLLWEIFHRLKPRFTEAEFDWGRSQAHELEASANAA